MNNPWTLCACKHRFDEHTSNYPNPGLGCDHAELRPPRGTAWDKIKVGCACMDFQPQEPALRERVLGFVHNEAINVGYTRASIAACMDISRVGLLRVLRELVKDGLIRRFQQRNRPTLYTAPKEPTL